MIAGGGALPALVPRTPSCTLVSRDGFCTPTHPLPAGTLFVNKARPLLGEELANLVLRQGSDACNV